MGRFIFCQKSAPAHYETMSFLATVGATGDSNYYRSDGADWKSTVWTAS